MLIARLSVSVQHAGATVVTITLTRRGRQLLVHSRRLAVISTGTFTPLPSMNDSRAEQTATLLNNGNQLRPVPVSSNPYTAGEPIVTTDNASDPNLAGHPINTVCPGSDLLGGLVNGAPVSGQVALNLAVACGTVTSVASVRTAFPGFNNINTLRNVANSIYHSLQFSANRTIGDLTVSLAYTYSHSIDDSSDRSDNAFVDAYNIARNRGRTAKCR